MTTLSKRMLSHSPEESREIGRKISSLLSPGDVVGLIGELGSGKTTLIKGILSGLNFEERNVSSASFLLVQEYRAKFLVYHLDLYRLDEPAQIYDIYLSNYIDPQAILLIEWAEKVESLIPFTIRIEIKFISENVREIILESKRLNR